MSDLLALISQRLEQVATEAGGRSAELDSSRSLPPDLVQSLIESGVFRLSVPERYGGLGVGVTSILRAVERTGRHDPSVGWLVLAGLVAGLDAAELPDHHARSIHGDATVLVVGDRHSPGGEARVRDDGSLLVSGRWSWGAGVSHCRWIGGPVRVVDEAGAPSALADGTAELHAYLERDQVTVLDTWHALGLRGAGATDYLASDAVVPEGRWVPNPRPSRVDRPSTTPAAADVFALGAAAVAIGVAGRAVEELVTLGAVDLGRDGGRLADWGSARVTLARAQAAVRALRSDIYAIAGRLDRSDPGRPPADAVTANLLSAAAYGTQSAADVVESCYRAAGPSAVHHASSLQRLLRDVEVIAHHPSVSVRSLERLGQALFAIAEADDEVEPTTG